jgi:chemotaxis response regulator CheB
MTRCFLESRARCEVCGEAANDIDAVEKTGTLNPDLILLDYSMPVLNRRYGALQLTLRTKRSGQEHSDL